MTAFAALFTVPAAASGVCGHPPLLPRLARQAWARLGPGEAHGATCAPAGGPHSPSKVSGDTEPATEPHNGRTGPRWGPQTQEQHAMTPRLTPGQMTSSGPGQLHHQLARAEAAIERVLALHPRNENTGDCQYCSARDYPDYAVPHPCDTVSALCAKEQH